LKFIAKHRLTFPNALDPDGDLAARFKLPAHPMALYIGANGQILGSRIGGVDEKMIKRDFQRWFF